MNLLTVIVLGIVQGFTDLFPVSSFAHLVIVQSFFPGFHQPGVAFDAVLHPGTLIAVAFYFHSDIGQMITSLLPKAHPNVSASAGPSASRTLVLLLIIREARLKYFAYYGWFFGTFTLLVKFSLF